MQIFLCKTSNTVYLPRRGVPFKSLHRNEGQRNATNTAFLTSRGVPFRSLCRSKERHTYSLLDLKRGANQKHSQKRKSGKCHEYHLLAYKRSARHKSADFQICAESSGSLEFQSTSKSLYHTRPNALCWNEKH